jgi:hypothetical protein
MRKLVVRFTEDPDWLPSVSRDITDAIHAELPDVDADPELRSSTYASTDSVLRLLADLSRSSLRPQQPVPPPAAVDLLARAGHRSVAGSVLHRARDLSDAPGVAGHIARVVARAAIEDLRDGAQPDGDTLAALALLPDARLTA